MAAPPSPALAPFHPLIRDWFAARLGEPTDVQRRAWPAIASGAHVLVTAPTGSGKTLTAFLWALHQFLTGAWATGGTRVLYVSPLKALNNDIQRNLLAPLAELRALAAAQGLCFPELQVLTRSGDTPPAGRRRMLRRPPEILITTPESLNLLLGSPRARETLAGVRTVILDEIHAVAAAKRGTHLITAVERLARLAGAAGGADPQRVALSATVRPVERVAAFVGGYRRAAGAVPSTSEGAAELIGAAPAGGTVFGAAAPGYAPRPVTIVRSGESKRLELEVRAVPEAEEGESLWAALAGELKGIARRNRSTLVFVNSRRLAEKLSRLMNEGEPRELAYAHHGSLSREVRLAVEQRLKEGLLPAVIATNSLELGIDVGDLDEVVLVQTPFSVASGLQRIGRAGHSVGRVSRGLLFPTHGLDGLDAAVMAPAILAQEIEELQPPLCPLDVLAQVILAMAGLEPWDVDELFAELRCAWPFHTLGRAQFDRVLEMLAGRYADSRIRELRPRVYLDREAGRVRGREGALLLVLQAGGTIPDRGYLELRVRGAGSRIGELDEEFVWERRVGDTFTLGNQSWRIAHIGDREVEVVPWEGPLNTLPFWRAERQSRDFRFCERIGLLLERWGGRLEDPAFAAELRGSGRLTEPARERLTAFLARQQAACGGLLPHRRRLLIEYSAGPPAAGGPGEGAAPHRVFLHNLWGRRVNEPLALLLAALWAERTGQTLEVFVDDHCLLLLLPPEADAAELLRGAASAAMERLLRRRLEGSGLFGARFRENAGRALLLPRSGFRRRVPLWLTRMRSRRLLEAVSRYPDFPILEETWRTCLQDEFDLPALRALLDEVLGGEIRLEEVRTARPSPFAEGLIWTQVNQHLYAGDEGRSASPSALSTDIIRQAALSAQLRPPLDLRTMEAFQARLQRLEPGYAPRDADDLLDWVRERLFIPEPEWVALLAAMERDAVPTAAGAADASDGGEPAARLLQAGRLVRLRFAGAAVEGATTLDLLPRLRAALEGPSADPGEGEDPLEPLLAEWLRSYGPLPRPQLSRVFGLAEERLGPALEALVESGTIVVDRLSRGAAGPEVCDAENLERLLRLQRARARPSFRALPAEALPLFLASWQGLLQPGHAAGDLPGALEKLFGWCAPAELWETELLPARLSPYYTHWLDSLARESALAWYGCGRGRIGFCPLDDYELVAEAGPAMPGEGPVPPAGRHPFRELLAGGGFSSERLTALLWEGVWAGRLSNDSPAALRRGVETRFRGEPLPAAAAGRTHPGRAALGRWRASRPNDGNWFRLPPPADAGALDPLDREELNRDRVRLLLQRYGVLFRELLEAEAPPLRWAPLFRTLRLMELSGEVLAGHFFQGIPGMQFLSHPAWRLLQKGLPEDAVCVLNAADPASLCGRRPEGFPVPLPPRLPTTHLFFLGLRLAVVSKRKGRELEILLPPDDPGLLRCLERFRDFLRRDYRPWKSVLVETVNGLPCRDSLYAPALQRAGFRPDYRAYALRG